MSDLLTAISILIATITWLLTYFQDRSARRVAHTADIIAGISTSDRLAESSFQVTKLINSGTKVSLSEIDPKTESHVVDILDYYEFLCDLYASHVLSRRTIVDLRGRLMKRTWDICETYIKETRKLQNRMVYLGFEKFVKELPPEVSTPLIAISDSTSDSTRKKVTTS
ncbi:MAG TPA: hypothetical protein VGB76_15175 [Pyrinomonadaceae bacterium]